MSGHVVILKNTLGAGRVGAPLLPIALARVRLLARRPPFVVRPSGSEPLIKRVHRDAVVALAAEPDGLKLSALDRPENRRRVAAGDTGGGSRRYQEPSR